MLEENAPNAASLIESLRDIGYTFKAALADIVDNGISAAAKNIDIHIRWNSGDPAIWIVDDGFGMTDIELFEAMKPGSRSPKEDRKLGDLGRFGLGLKTASFSQCRQLTVISRKNNITTSYRWDLDLVAEKNAWLIQRLSEEEIASLPQKPDKEGTIVLWRKLDRTIDQTVEDPQVRFNEKMDRARSHLELVFHRFIQGEKGLSSIKFSMNMHPLVSFDPFNLKNSATQRLPEETISVGDGAVKIRPFILPHHSKCTQDEFRRYASDEGYTKSQGFYIYRNKRLIDHGTWFRLAPMSDANRLARVQIDIGNESDHIWQVDVKKSRISPPSKIRRELRRVIEQITDRSKRTYSRRGYVRRYQHIIPLWERHATQGRIEYRIKRDHPLVDHLLSLMEEDGKKLDSLLSIIESSYPRNQLFADMSNEPQSVDSGMKQEEMLAIATDIYSEMKELGADNETIERMLGISEPFASYDGLLKQIIENEENG